MLATTRRNQLADCVAAVEIDATPGFRCDVARCLDVHIGGLPLGQIVGKEADAVGIDAAQVGGHERVGDQVAGYLGCAGGGGELPAELAQVRGFQKGHMFTIQCPAGRDKQAKKCFGVGRVAVIIQVADWGEGIAKYPLAFFVAIGEDKANKNRRFPWTKKSAHEPWS